jgi:predicted HicB family RNase H-like nuclease
MVLKAKTSRRDSSQKQEALEAAAQEETKRLNLEIPASLHKTMKKRAAEEGRSVKDMVLQAINEYLSNYSNE